MDHSWGRASRKREEISSGIGVQNGEMSGWLAIADLARACCELKDYRMLKQLEHSDSRNEGVAVVSRARMKAGNTLRY